MKPVKIEVASSREIDKDLGSKMIEWFQGEAFSHVLFIVTYDSGFEEIFHCVERGVCREPLKPFLKDHVLPHRVEVQPQDGRTLRECLAYMEGCLEIRYSRLSQFVGFALEFLQGKLRDGRATMKCSEFLVDVLQFGLGYSLGEVDEDFTTPKSAIALTLSLARKPD